MNYLFKYQYIEDKVSKKRNLSSRLNNPSTQKREGKRKGKHALHGDILYHYSCHESQGYYHTQSDLEQGKHILENIHSKFR